MKKYKEFILEKLNNKEFEQTYVWVLTNLEKFWQDLSDKIEIEEFDDINNRNSQEVFEYNEKIRNERKSKKQDVQTEPDKKIESQPKTDKKVETQIEPNKEVSLDPKVLTRLRRENSDKLVNYLYDSKYKEYYNEINKILNGRFLAYSTDQLLDKLKKPQYRDKVDEIKNILTKRQLKKTTK